MVLYNPNHPHLNHIKKVLTIFHNQLSIYPFHRKRENSISTQSALLSGLRTGKTQDDLINQRAHKEWQILIPHQLYLLNPPPLSRFAIHSSRKSNTWRPKNVKYLNRGWLLTASISPKLNVLIWGWLNKIARKESAESLYTPQAIRACKPLTPTIKQMAGEKYEIFKQGLASKAFMKKTI